uniref:Putative secreted protein n=1 Tax=Anopheles triannulatus TaxID=58253 RepID=A0A2M4B3M4_9DIPT
MVLPVPVVVLMVVLPQRTSSNRWSNRMCGCERRSFGCGIFPLTRSTKSRSWRRNSRRKSPKWPNSSGRKRNFRRKLMNWKRSLAICRSRLMRPLGQKRW